MDAHNPRWTFGGSPRVRRLFDELGVSTPEEAAKLDPMAILRTQGVGRKTMSEISEILARHGFGWGLGPTVEDFSFDPRFNSASARLRWALYHLNIRTPEEAAEWTEQSLLRTPNVGRKSVDELRNILRDSGLEFTSYSRETDPSLARDTKELLSLRASVSEALTAIDRILARRRQG